MRNNSAIPYRYALGGTSVLYSYPVPPLATRQSVRLDMQGLWIENSKGLTFVV